MGLGILQHILSEKNQGTLSPMGHPGLNPGTKKRN